MNIDSAPSNGDSAPSAEGSSDMLQPGLIIRPEMTEKTAMCLVNRLYGLTVTSIKELNSYDDKNYLVQVSPQHTNPHLTNPLCPHGYVLKVLNSLDSPKQHVEAQHGMMHVMRQNKMTCSYPITNLNGKQQQRLTSVQLREDTNENIIEQGSQDAPHGVHMVRLMTFLPGKILAEVDYTPQLLYQAGKYVGAMNRHLQDFSHPSLTHHKTVWSLGCLPQMADFVYAIRDDSRRQLINDVLSVWGQEVEPLYKHFRKGVIHGDFNEQNVIVQPKAGTEHLPESQKEYHLHGVIDFGDAQDTYYVFEVAIAIMYMMVESHVVDPLEAGGHVLAGYLSERDLNQWEWDALKVCVAGRFAQSMTMGEYTYSQDPGNEYVLVCAKNGWPRLRRMWDTPKAELYEGWRRVIDGYKAT